jgi:DNA-binding CsgD family transcriptional regulator
MAPSDELSTFDLRSILTLIGRLHEVRGIQQLTELLTAELGSIVPNDLITFNDIDQALDLWPEMLQTWETNNQIVFAVVTSPGRVAGIRLDRWDRDFSGRDLAAARLLQSHLSAAFDHARLREATDPDGAVSTDVLTTREREVLALVAGGRSNREIARLLFIHHRTVEKHNENILAKLGARSRTEAAAVYLRDNVRG